MTKIKINNKETKWGKYVELTQQTLKKLQKKAVSMVEFQAPWCGPCRMIAPVIEELACRFRRKSKHL